MNRARNFRRIMRQMARAIRRNREAFCRSMRMRNAWTGRGHVVESRRCALISLSLGMYPFDSAERIRMREELYV